MSIAFQVTYDCADPDALAHFWAEALGYIVQPPPEGFESWSDWLAVQGLKDENQASAIVDPDGARPRLFFQRVPEGKTAKNRVHLDINVGGGLGVSVEERKARVTSVSERLLSLGATHLEDHHEDGNFHRVLQDPEGNEFCLQ